MPNINREIKKILEKIFNVEITRPKSNLRESQALIVNESVNFEKEVIFVAIPKTGTTTIRTQLKQVGIPLIENPHLNIVQIRTLIYVHLLKENLGINITFPNANTESDIALREKADEMFNSFFKFSAVRNPWARAVSLYYRREGVKLKNEMTFGEFCENHIYASDTCRQPTLHHNQYDWLSDSKGRILVDYVYKVEDFKNAINNIKSQTNGRLILNNVELNQNPNSKSKDYRNLYNDRTRKTIEKRFEKDIDYFKYTF